MSTPAAASGLLLWVRAAVLSVVAMTTGAVAHVQADGLLPGTTTLVVLTALGAAAGAPFLRRPGTTLRIVGLLVAGQSAVHTALAATAGHRGDPARPDVVQPLAPPVAPVGSGTRRGSYFDVAYSAPTGGAGEGLSLPAPLLHAVTDVVEHPWMALAHLVAAAFVGWWLAMGERSLWTLLGLTARAWSELATPALTRWVLAARAVTVRSLDLPVVLLAVPVLSPPAWSATHDRSLSRRGPPRAA